MHYAYVQYLCFDYVLVFWIHLDSLGFTLDSLWIHLDCDISLDILRLDTGIHNFF